MSRVSNKSFINNSATTDAISKWQSRKPTIFYAINKLKQEQQKIVQEHNRYKVLHRHSSKEHINAINYQQKQSIISMVRNSVSMDKEAKKLSQDRKMQELKSRYSINFKHREDNKNMIDNVRKSFHNANHSLYEEIRKKKNEHEKLINFEKSKILEQKLTARKQAQEQEDRRRKSIQNFYESRVLEKKMIKSNQIEQMLRKSEDRHRVYDFLSSRNSKARETNKSRVSSARNDTKNPQNKQTIC